MIDNITNIDISGALQKARAVRPCVPGLIGLDHPDLHTCGGEERVRLRMSKRGSICAYSGGHVCEVTPVG